MAMVPPPSQASHLPPLILNENLPSLYPLALASGVEANTARISVKSPVYVAGLERGLRPMGDWSMLIMLVSCMNDEFEEDRFSEHVAHLLSKSEKLAKQYRVNLHLNPEKPEYYCDLTDEELEKQY